MVIGHCLEIRIIRSIKNFDFIHMSDNVQFDTDTQNNAIRRPAPIAGFGQTTSEASGMAGWLMRHGWAKTPAVAQGIMVAIIIIDIIITFIVIKYFL